MSDQVDVVDTAAVATAAVETPVAEVATMEAAMANVAAAEAPEAEAPAEAEAEAATEPAEDVSPPVEGGPESAAEPDEEAAPVDLSKFELPSHADIRMGAEIHEQCRAALEASGDVVVDCSSVERVDAAVLQCLGSLVGSLHEGARSLEFSNRTESFDRAVALLGFDDLLFRHSPDAQG